MNFGIATKLLQNCSEIATELLRNCYRIATEQKQIASETLHDQTKDFSIQNPNTRPSIKCKVLRQYLSGEKKAGDKGKKN